MHLSPLIGVKDTPLNSGQTFIADTVAVPQLFYAAKNIIENRD